MTSGEYRFLILAMGWILASVPLALLIWQVWLRPRPAEHPVIPPADAEPAGSFLDVALPPPLPGPPEHGVPVRHWKRLDGWVALLTLVILCLLMGPLSTGQGEEGAEFQISAELLTVNLIFQLGMAGLLLIYLGKFRRFDVGRIFGLRRHRWYLPPAVAAGWLIPGLVLVGLVTHLVMPPLLEWLGQKETSPQGIVQALKHNPDSLTKVMTLLTVGVGAPLMEELIFRGFLYGVAKRFTHWSYAALASSLFFAVVHANVMSFVPLTVLGLLFVAAYEQSRNLLVPVLMHAIFNLMQVLILFYAPNLVEQLQES